MAFRQPGSVVRNAAPSIVDGGKLLIAAILLLAVVATFGLRTVVSLDALAPTVATVFFGAAVVAGVLGLLMRRYVAQTGFIEVAGILTFVGVIVSMAIEPEQIVRLLTPGQAD